MNRICEILRIAKPIIQGGMTRVSDASLVSAVSNGGGLGIIGTGSMSAEMLREEIRKTYELTNEPFGVNLIRQDPRFDEQMMVVLEERPAVVTLGAIDKTEVIGVFKEAGIKVLPVVSTVVMARRCYQYGADAIIAEGSEAGGHIGDTTTMVLVPLVFDALRSDDEGQDSIPVIAAGGIVDGRGMAAAFALGAEGVQIGTRFVCATECSVHPAIKEKFISVGDRATVVMGKDIGLPVRAIKNRLTKEYRQYELDCLDPNHECTKMDVENFGLGKLREAMQEGNVKDGSMMAGQGAALVRKIQPAAEIIHEVYEEATSIAPHIKMRLA
jgi:enoyl-[acyl-carrier protein] reductase II